MTETTPDPTTYKGTVLKILAKADEPLPPRKIIDRMEGEPEAGIGTQLSALVEEDRVERVSDMDKYGSAYRATDKGVADINVEETPDTSSPTDPGDLSGLFDDMEEEKAKVSETSDEDPRNGANDDDKAGEGIEEQEHTAADPTMSDDARGPVEELVDPKVAAFAEIFADVDNVLAVSDEGLTDLIHAVATTEDLPRAKRRAIIAALADAKKPTSALSNAIRRTITGENESDIRRVPVPKVVRDMEK